MKHKRPFVAICAVSLLAVNLQAQTTLFTENFDSYTKGAYVSVVSPQFVTWSGTQGGADDVMITDEKSSTAPHSIMLSASAAQGDQDLVMKLDNKTSGVYEISFKILVGSGATEGAYFNMLQALPPSPEWGFSLTFLPDLSLGFNWNNIPVVIGTYTKDVWNDIKVRVDLDKDSAWMWFNNAQVTNWVWSTKESGGIGIKQLAGVNFYCYAGGVAGTTVKYFVDDILYVQHVLNPGMANHTTPEPVIAVPNPANETIRFTIRNISDISIFSMSGTLVKSFRSQDGIADIANLETGVYFAKIFTGEQVEYVRFIKR